MSLHIRKFFSVNKLTTRLSVATLVAVMLIANFPQNIYASPVRATYNVWFWNVAGRTINGGSTTNGMTRVATESILNRNANLVAFNEICWSQYTDIKNRLKNAGWPQDNSNFSRFRWQRKNEAGVCNGRPFGLAIFTKSPLSDARGTALPSDGTGERRVLLCAALADTGNAVRFCTTHMTYKNHSVNGEPIRVQQLDAARERLERYRNENGARVIVAGDFNSEPHHRKLDGWYSPIVNTAVNKYNTGSYREIDDTDARCPGYGEVTVWPNKNAGACFKGRKIDYIFAREEFIDTYWSGDSLSVSSQCGGYCSDHRILKGTVRLNLN